MSAAATPVRTACSPPSETYARYVLVTLFCVYMILHLDRMTISLLLEPIGKEFRLTDAERGLLAGVAYAIPFAIAGIPLGMLIDRVNRVRLLVVLLAVWSGLTALCALASSFPWLLLARIGVGAAESGGTPANVALIADYFGPERRSRAYGVYYMAPHIATIFGFALAGRIATVYGWRAAFLLVGLPGLVLVVLLVRTIREPPRGGVFPAIGHATAPPPPPGAAATGAEPAPSLVEVLCTLARNRPALHLLIGCTLSSMVAAGIFTWLAPFMIRLHGFSVQQAGFAVSLGMAPFAALASLLGGTLADRLGGYRSPRVPVMLAAAIAVAVAAIIIGLTASAVPVLIGAFAVQMAGYVLTVGPSYAGVLGLMPAKARGVSAALMQVSANVLGFGAGAFVLGKLSDVFRPELGNESLRYTMLAFSLIDLWAIAHFLAAARALGRGVRGRSSDRAKDTS